MKKNDLKKPGKLLLAISVLTSCMVLITSASFSNRKNADEVPYPEGFRNWTHVKTVIIEKGSPAFAHWGGFHHIYGNSKAIEGYNTGKFEDGATIVFDVIEALSKDSMIIEGRRKLIDVMVKDSRKYKSTGGWGYEEFPGDSKTERSVGALSVTACYNCHAQQKINDNVFSKLRN
jgi:hypothetical protein